MKTIKLSESFNHRVSEVWKIVGDLSRTDWVSGVEEITLVNDTREFFMEGMGKLTEKIILCSDKRRRLEYCVIRAPVKIKHHLAIIELTKIEEDCLLNWTTEIDPEIYGSGIEQGMIACLKQLKKILNNQLP